MASAEFCRVSLMATGVCVCMSTPLITSPHDPSPSVPSSRKRPCTTVGSASERVMGGLATSGTSQVESGRVSVAVVLCACDNWNVASRTTSDVDEKISAASPSRCPFIRLQPRRTHYQVHGEAHRYSSARQALPSRASAGAVRGLPVGRRSPSSTSTDPARSPCT
jgi:hypothetical protein